MKVIFALKDKCNVLFLVSVVKIVTIWGWREHHLSVYYKLNIWIRVVFLVEPLQMPDILCMQPFHILLSWVGNLLGTNWCPHHQCDRLSVLAKWLTNSKMITPVGDDSETVLEDASTQEDDWSKPCYWGEQVLDPPQKGALLALQLRESPCWLVGFRPATSAELWKQHGFLTKLSVIWTPNYGSQWWGWFSIHWKQVLWNLQTTW